MAVRSIPQVTCKTNGSAESLHKAVKMTDGVRAACWRPKCPKFRVKCVLLWLSWTVLVDLTAKEHSWSTLAWSQTSLKALCQCLEIRFYKKIVVKRDLEHTTVDPWLSMVTLVLPSKTYSWISIFCWFL